MTYLYKRVRLRNIDHCYIIRIHHEGPYGVDGYYGCDDKYGCAHGFAYFFGRLEDSASVSIVHTVRMGIWEHRVTSGDRDCNHTSLWFLAYYGDVSITS